MKKPLVSIIILNFNGFQDTKTCLTSLKKTTYSNSEILVIDNGSYEDEGNLIRQEFGNFANTFRLKKNRGFTGGNNWALKRTTGKYIVLLNNDTEVEPEWLDYLVDVMEKDSKIAAAQPKILLMKNKKYFDYAGAAGGYIDKYGYPFTRGRIFDTIEKDKGQYNNPCDIFWASGAACIIRKSAIKKLGGLFSQNLFNYMEEIDFCWRAWNKGYRVVFAPNSIVYHKVAATSKKDLYKKRFWEHRNNLFILTRNLERKDLIKILPFRFFLEIITYLYYLSSPSTGGFKYASYLFAAHLDYLRKSINVRLARKRYKTYQKLPIFPGSIVNEYYIKGNKQFSSLDWSPKGNLAYLLWSSKENTGGKVVFEHANKFKEKGYGVKIYTILPPQKPTWFRLKVDLKFFLYSYLDRQPDVLVATFWPTAYISLLMKGKNKYHFTQDWEEDFYRNPILKLFARLTYTLPIKKIAISRYLKKRIENYDKSSYPIYRVNYSVLDTSIFKRKSSIRDKIRVKKNVNVLSVISWYNFHKGPDLLEKAVKILKEKHKNYRFTLVSRENKPYSPVIDKFVSNPKKTKLAKLYQNSDLLLITSRSEGFFIPGLEAMASGCPVVTTNSNGILEYARNGKNAVVLKKIEDLWEKDVIEKLIKNKKLRIQLIKKGYQTIHKYGLEKIAEELEKIYFINDS